MHNAAFPRERTNCFYDGDFTNGSICCFGKKCLRSFIQTLKNTRHKPLVEFNYLQLSKRNERSRGRRFKFLKATIVWRCSYACRSISYIRE